MYIYIWYIYIYIYIYMYEWKSVGCLYISYHMSLNQNENQDPQNWDHSEEPTNINKPSE